jgi:lipopolysaccharide/colanic/teichoic acid biosynthesis glycosyltransferase
MSLFTERSTRADSPETVSVSFGAIPLRHSRYLRFRNFAERAIAFAFFLLLLPVMLVLGLLVRIGSPGGALYHQKRLGQFGREYWMIKIRSMRHDSEEVTGPVWAAKRDDRVTPLGQFMRETHLDELPQLWNVVRGEMSIIGPRPERAELARKIEKLAPNYRERLQLRPGLTGLAQVKLPADRDVSDACRKLAFDLYYVRHVNLTMDLRIAASTLFHLSGLVADSLGKGLVRSCSIAVEQSQFVELSGDDDPTDEMSPV